MIPELMLSLMAGWFAGGLGNLAADHLPDVHDGGISLHPPSWSHYWTLWWIPWRRTCPHCGQKRPLRVPLLEVAMALMFGVTWFLLRDQPLPLIALTWLYGGFLIVILVIDYEQRRVLNVMLAPAAVILLLLSLLPSTPDLRSVLLGGLVGFGLFLLLYVIGRGSMGAGDVKLAGVIGLMTGYPAVWSALLLGVILGGVAAVGVLVSRRGTRKSSMAYAPYLAMGAMITIWVILGQ